ASPFVCLDEAELPPALRSGNVSLLAHCVRTAHANGEANRTSAEARVKKIHYKKGPVTKPPPQVDPRRDFRQDSRVLSRNSGRPGRRPSGPDSFGGLRASTERTQSSFMSAPQ